MSGILNVVVSPFGILISFKLLEYEDSVTNLNYMKIMLYLFCQLVEMGYMERRGKELNCSSMMMELVLEI